ncbi:MAG: UDP-N-acetylmuramoyl-L-alanine--D-glutamate ligase [Parachlamydia sp.]|nr:UDP-N-acetylmuramoyl-L-alanine--D-glutamate ligase [Parachlamydia sp.]
MYQGRNVLVIGLGLSGRAAAGFLLKRGARVHGIDRDRELLASHEEIKGLYNLGFSASLESEPLDVGSFDLVVVSPGVPQTNPCYAAALSAGIEIIGEMELACRHMNQRCFGITGSNGKTTTTMLVTHVLNHSGRKARALGNIGMPLTEALDAHCDGEILVIELSSWQLETLHARVFDAGAILNITPNHLDRHKTMLNYARAKINLKNCLKVDAPLFMGKVCREEFEQLLEGVPAKTFGFDSSCNVYSDRFRVYFEKESAFELPSEFQGKATHDVENMMAGYALCRMAGVSGEEFLAAQETFRKPPHRIEFVKKIEGVAYYDDSKGTSIAAVEKAVIALEGPIHLIAGGVHKGASYAPWRETFRGRVSHVYAIGQAASQIKSDVGDLVPVEMHSSLGAALESAALRARPGENVLLSPGCSSYDMFKDYNHRGDEFQRLVSELKIGKKA